MQNDDRVDGIGKQSNLLANNLPKMADTADDALASFDFLSSEPSDGKTFFQCLYVLSLIGFQPI